MILSAVVSISLTMLFLLPLLFFIGPIRFVRNVKRVALAMTIILALSGAVVLTLYLISAVGKVNILGPGGTPLFYNRLLQDCVDPMY